MSDSNSMPCSFEDALKRYIGEEVYVVYGYKENSRNTCPEDTFTGYDYGILKEVGDGYIILDFTGYENYAHDETIINLTSVSNIYLKPRRK